jgi:hypothetical protein
VIIADTGAILALLDADEEHHPILRKTFEGERRAWLLPWAILPEVDYLALAHLGRRVQQAFLDDLVSGAFVVEWGVPADLDRARELDRRYRGLELGLVDTVVMAMAERRRAEAIATLDERHFGAVKLRRHLKLLPRDLT